MKSIPWVNLRIATGRTLLGLQMYGYIACTAGLIILQARNTLPEIVGLALFTDGHIGYYVGGGYAVEWRGFNYGCVKTVVKERTWKQDGKYGDQTHTALMAAVADKDVGQQTQPEPEQEQPTGPRVKIVCNSGTVNIRTGNGTSYSRITAVAPGTTLEYVASALNGWQAVKIGSQVGWVSGEYSEITSE